jgi:hypothetical protein
MRVEGWVEVALAVWMLVLSVALLGLGRQISDLFFAIRTGRAPKTGERLLLRNPVPPEVLEAIAEVSPDRESNKDEELFVLHFSAQCGGCLQAVNSLAASYRDGTHHANRILGRATCLLTGSGGNKDVLMDLLKKMNLPVIEDPKATVLARQLRITMSPFAMRIFNSEVAGWSEIMEFRNLERMVLQGSKSASHAGKGRGVDEGEGNGSRTRPVGESIS